MRYTNAISFFDYVTPRFEHYCNAFLSWAMAFDSAYSLWYLKTQKMAEFRARRKLEEEIVRKQAEGDEISQVLLKLDKIEDLKDIPEPK